MSEEKELRFIRLNGDYEDLIGYVTHYNDYIVIEKPLRIEIDTYFEDSRQILSLQEYLPQSIIDMQEIEFPRDQVMFTFPVKQDFVEQYTKIAEFFYEVQPKNKPTQIKEPKEDISEAAQKVVSILEAIQSKKDKPIH